MNKLYLKNQWFYIIVSLALFCYCTFFYVQNSNKKEIIVETLKITDKRCSAASGIRNYVKIKKGDKVYTIDLSEEKCADFEIGDKIELNYNKKYDYYFISSMNISVKLKLIFSSLFLLISISYIRNICTKYRI